MCLVALHESQARLIKGPFDELGRFRRHGSVVREAVTSGARFQVAFEWDAHRIEFHA